MEKSNIIYVNKNDDGTVSYDVEKFPSLHEAEIAEWKAGERTEESLEKILLKRLNPTAFVSDKGKSTWKKFVSQIYEVYSKIPDECCCERIEKKVLEAKVDEPVYVDLANTHYGGVDLEARKEKDGTIHYCLRVCAEGEEWSDGFLFCPFCGKKLKRTWK